MIKLFIKKTAARFGYEIHRKVTSMGLGYDLENEAEDSLRRVQPYAMLSRERLIALYQQVVHCERNSIAGDFVECGVWKGGAVALEVLN